MVKDKDIILKAYAYIQRSIRNPNLKNGLLAKMLQDEHFFELDDIIQTLILDFIVSAPNKIDKLKGFMNFFVYRRLIDYQRKLETLKRAPKRINFISIDQLEGYDEKERRYH